MSMSQEEIEALMNGLDISEESEEAGEEDNALDVIVNTEEIESILSQSEESEFKKDKPTSIVNSEEIDALLKDIEATKEIPNIVDEEIFQEDVSTEVNIEESSLNSYDINDVDPEELAKTWTSRKIEAGLFPYPAEKDTKVVNQLSQVASDSEEKGQQIFDVLSSNLDNNAYLDKKINEIQSFVILEEEMLSNLANKFPNIQIFQEHLLKTINLNNTLKEMKNSIKQEDMKIFGAMELMQFNDINRQKLERVMSVIRKLSTYLNNIFEDDGSMKEVSIAKHIHGDENNNLVGDDLDKLIAEFAK